MEQLEIEQTENKSQTAVAEENVNGDGKQEFSFKGFKDVESLQKAYSSLESEFTKRSQRLKQLEGEKLELIKQLDCNKQGLVAERAEDFYQNHPKARELRTEILASMALGAESGENVSFAKAYIKLLEQRLSDLSEKGKSEEYLLSQIEGTAIKDKIIKNYLEDIKNHKQTAVMIGSAGEAVLAPPKRPKTLLEAGAMAREIFNK